MSFIKNTLFLLFIPFLWNLDVSAQGENCSELYLDSSSGISSWIDEKTYNEFQNLFQYYSSPQVQDEGIAIFLSNLSLKEKTTLKGAYLYFSQEPKNSQNYLTLLEKYGAFGGRKKHFFSTEYTSLFAAHIANQVQQDLLPAVIASDTKELISFDDLFYDVKYNQKPNFNDFTKDFDNLPDHIKNDFFIFVLTGKSKQEIDFIKSDGFKAALTSSFEVSLSQAFIADLYFQRNWSLSKINSYKQEIMEYISFHQSSFITQIENYGEKGFLFFILNDLKQDIVNISPTEWAFTKNIAFSFLDFFITYKESSLIQEYFSTFYETPTQDFLTAIKEHYQNEKLDIKDLYKSLKVKVE